MILAHGYRDGETWRFSNGQSVLKTVTAFDEYASLNGLPKIEFVIACNREPGPNPLGIKIKDFPQGKIVAQAVGEDVKIHLGGQSQISQKGRVSMSLEVDTEFWGLDDLMVLKQVKVSDAE